jgi:hypothetical protein
MHNAIELPQEVEDALAIEQKNGKELAVKLVDHLIVMGASVCHLNVDAEGAKYQVTVKFVSA